MNRSSIKDGSDLCAGILGDIAGAASCSDTPADFYLGFVSLMTGGIAKHIGTDAAIDMLREILGALEKGREVIERGNARVN